MTVFSKHKKELEILCENHFVKELFVFGSVAKGEENESSDVDFLVEFEGYELLDYFDNYFDFKSSLEKLLERKVDLLEVQALKNPILKDAIEKDKILVYGRQNKEVAI